MRPGRPTRKDGLTLPRAGAGPVFNVGSRSCSLLTVLVLLCLSLLRAGPAWADPAYEGPLLFGLDPVIKATDDPRLLGVDRLIMRQRLAYQGVDLSRGPYFRPGLTAALHQVWREKSRVDVVREIHLIEYNGSLGLVTDIHYPSYFFLFPTAQALPGGFYYYPPRELNSSGVRIFVDDIELGLQRRLAVDRVRVLAESLDVAGKGRIGTQDDGLLNLTIPIKLPRTLEKIIGRGEKTRIKITGREHISISGESTIVKPFIATETVQNQSLFPSLDMQQELQVNLSGTIGEKIILEVDHNSAQIGPEATKIKLMFQGDEDEIIKTIETGDVGLTLPGSQLLGYSSNKSGLFGIKVTGQVGRADFTVVASKQKAESSSKTFNSKGGQVREHSIPSSSYLNNRFFFLDLPGGLPGIDIHDQPGRSTGQNIDPNSIQIFKRMGVGEYSLNEVPNIAAFQDSSGTWDPNFLVQKYKGSRWQRVEFDPLYDTGFNLIGIDLRSSYYSTDVLAVIYDVVDADGGGFSVGERPGREDPGLTIEGEGDFFRMKLLKGMIGQNAYTYQYVLRNIYSLGASNIDPESFDLRIERDVPSEAAPDLELEGIPYIQIFGLDENDGREGGPRDGLVDRHNNYIFDLSKGLLRFPLNFPKPFAASQVEYEDNAEPAAADWWENTWLSTHLEEQLYLMAEEPNLSSYGSFRIVASHAAAQSTFNLGASNIEEESETVSLDGRTLTRGTDYEIDYTFGQISLKGEAANLTSSSQISVDYQYAPFFGGGKTSLLGIHLGYDLGRNSGLAGTVLYQTESIIGEKAKLGEEPSKSLVGNLSFQHELKPYLLTHVANFIGRRNSEKESSLNFSGEIAVSVPNPNTKGEVYLEDFEGVESSDLVGLSRSSWFWASAPLDTNSVERDPEDRAKIIRWFRAPEGEATRRWHLNPTLINQEREETQQTLLMYLSQGDGLWSAGDWGGIMRGISRTGIDLSKSQFVEFWVNDRAPDPGDRSGRIHIDFGYINEDGFWPVLDDGSLKVGDYETEDGIDGSTPDGKLGLNEDIGLAGEYSAGLNFQEYGASYEYDGDTPFPRINNTAGNLRMDSEDINGNDFYMENGYFSFAVDLADTALPLVDVLRDYRTQEPGDVAELEAANISWRKYRVKISEAKPISGGTIPDIRLVTHVRIWFEDDDFTGQERVLEFSDLKFLGSRWERQGIRRVADESLLSFAERGLDEGFFLGEVNNKEDPDYAVPFAIHEENQIPEKEQSLVLDFQDLEAGHMVRASKYVSPTGDDYTGYRRMSWYFYNETYAGADANIFFRVGSDTLNYYQLEYRYGATHSKVGWQKITLDIAELSNAKNGELDLETGVISSTIQDYLSTDQYQVKVVGRPDLRRIKRYYFGVANDILLQPISGRVYMNDLKLEGVKKDIGFAKRAGLRLDMADVIRMDFDWSKRDDEFRGLDKRQGSGVNYEDWNFSSNLKVEDFVPLAGFKLPVNVSRRQQVERPKYQTNSDIEIIEQEVRNKFSTIDTQERFSARLSHSSSKSFIPRYFLDPWVFMANGSRSNREGPLDTRFQKTLQGSVNYDLRIAGNRRLGDIPGLGSVPLLKGLAYVPHHLDFGGNFNSSFTSSNSISETGVIIPRPTTKNRPAVLNASVDYRPLSVLNLSVSSSSERDLLAEELKWGLNIGRENKRSYDFRMTITLPSDRQLPGGKVFYPLRLAVRGARGLRPSIQFNGQFIDLHSPGIRQQGDPEDIRNLSNSGNWEVRFNVPVSETFDKLFPENKLSQADKDRMIERQRRLENTESRISGGRGTGRDLSPDGSGGPEEDAPTDEDPYEGMGPEAKRRREDKRLLEEAEERLAEEEELAVARALEEDGPPERLKIPNPLDPMLYMIRNMSPVKVTLTNRRTSSYTRIQERAAFWFKTGLVSSLDTADSLYSGQVGTDRESLSLSSASKLSRNITIDLKYSQNIENKDQNNSLSTNYQQDWPDAQLSIGGLEKWRILGGDPANPEAGMFQSSNISFSYRHSKTVNGMTATAYNPRWSTSINPRWSFTFHSGLAMTLTTTSSKDRSEINGSLITNSRLRVGLNLRHQFRAQSFLIRMGIYRPGSTPTINMDVDVSYDKDTNERINPGNLVLDPSGSTRVSINPRFSYQVTRNLSGALRFNYSRGRNISDGRTTTSLGIGVEATFVF